MKYLYKLYIGLTVMLLACTGLSSCNKNDHEPSSGIPTDALFDFVTFVSTDASGSIFEMRRSDDSPLIQYTSTYSLVGNKNFEPGKRMIICYKPLGGAAYVSGPIDLFGVVALSNTEQNMLTGTAAEYNGFISESLTMNSFWRSGQYINFNALAYVYQTGAPKKLVLVADKATLGEKVPTLYIVYISATGNEGSNGMQIYASFDISEIWNNPAYTAVKIKYQAPSGIREQIFDKSVGNLPIQPVN